MQQTFRPVTRQINSEVELRTDNSGVLTGLISDEQQELIEISQTNIRSGVYER
jgi:hypothetical protein